VVDTLPPGVYDLKVASLYPKKIGGRTYYYLREMARVDGSPTMVSERYLGSAEDIAAAVAARDGRCRNAPAIWRSGMSPPSGRC
jgi:hypothetical protein